MWAFSRFKILFRKSLSSYKPKKWSAVSGSLENNFPNFTAAALLNCFAIKAPLISSVSYATIMNVDAHF
jgi:hypothetical protein